MRILQVDYMGCLYYHFHAKDRDPAWEFLKKLREIIKQFSVDKTLLLLEGGSSYRQKIYPGYKAGRKARREQQPEAEKKRHADFIKVADHFAKEIAPLLGILPVRVFGAEADDLAAYLCQHVDTSQHQILNLSGDQDWYQLLRKNVVQGSYSEIQKEVGAIPSSVWLSEKGFEKRYGIPVSQWIWKKCLAGDTGDSVKGIEHLGEGTALKLLQEYGSIEEIERQKDLVEVPRMKKQAKEALAANFPLVYENYKVMNLCHAPEVEQEIFGSGLLLLEFVLNMLPVGQRVQKEAIMELSYERGWLEIDEGWLSPFA